MTMRLATFGVLLCSMLAADEPTSAQRLWEQGQDAMRNGRTDVAVGCEDRLRQDVPGLSIQSLRAAPGQHASIVV